MPSDKPIAVVTGANRGLGLEACRQLAVDFDHRVVLTSRNPEAGRLAAGRLREQGLDVAYHPLDVTVPRDIERFARNVRDQFGRLDVLVNNAGIMIDRQGRPRDGMPGVLDVPVEVVQETFETNLYGPYRLVQALVPLMREGGSGRIVNVSSGMGQLAEMGGGWPAYRMSKTALNALTRILAEETRGTGILVNAVCPGWVQTGIGGARAPRTVEEGADTIVWLATLPPEGPTGGFFRDRRPIPW